MQIANKLFAQRIEKNGACRSVSLHEEQSPTI